ncbi:hypothetical protein IV203_007978 [Nitzschia inconspicua]|uniref:Uncharacterized protein n=1 Tax=Nitzschia inconspicua TaxID=303405 RepID=A0A9K3KZL1_9STRA|nr:hypothetical protein IV203_007978 [Nitzschia inconspicua]
MMRTTIEDTVSDSDDDDDDDDLFSPIEGRRSSLHDLLTPTTPASRETPPSPPPRNDSLPRLQDNSWIGAQVSPIPNNAEEEDNENDHDDHHHQNSGSIHIGAPKFRSIQDYHSSFVTTGSSAAGGSPMITEKTSLLGHQRRRHQHHNNDHNNNNNNTNTANLHQRNHTYKQQQQQQQPHSTLPVTLEEGPTPSIQHGQHLPSSSYPTTTSKKQHPWTFQSFKGRSNIPIPSLRDMIMSLFNHKNNNNNKKQYLHYFIPATTGIFLALVALHDIFLMYLSWRRGVATTYSLAWSWPWGSPSTRSLIRFGAYYHHQDAAPWWRLVTASLWVTNSVTEWVVLVLAWTWGISINNYNNNNSSSSSNTYNSHQLPNHIGQSWIQSRLQQPKQTNPHPSSSSSSTRTPWYLHWSVVYTVSILTGILWMRMSTKMMIMTNTNNSMAVDGNDGEDTTPIVTVAIGCTSWGTAGVLCATGMQRPQRRFELFLLAMGLLLLKVWPQQTSSAVVWAAIGSTFFGWAYASNFITTHPPNNAGVANNNNDKHNYNNTMGSPSSWHYYYDVQDGNFKETATKPAKMGKTWLRVAAAIVTISLWFVPVIVIWVITY